MSSDKDLEQLERKHVQSVYQAIAPHFSATRYKPWPVVESFLQAIPDGSVGADVGCGNGKYLGVNPNIFTIGSDMSSNLIRIVKERGLEGMVCDNLNLPYRNACFDFVISIAVIHHFSSFDRRVAAVKELVRTLKSGGKLLVFVWALEQEDGSKRKFDKQDVFVPWNMDTKISKPTNSKKAAAGKSDEIKAVETSETGLAIGTDAVSNADESSIDITSALSKLSLNSKTDEIEPTVIVKSGNENIIYQRYYHVFVKGELDKVVEAAGGVTIEVSGYDRDNWYIIANKV